MAIDDKPCCRVAVAGAGFSGAILARQLRMEPGFEVVCFEKMAEKSVRKHWTQPVTGAGASQLLLAQPRALLRRSARAQWGLTTPARP